MLFNLFYTNLVNKLQSRDSGVRIGKNNFNCFCYADDLLLCSVTVKGLQSMLDTCVEYVSSHGLGFNPSKKTCFILGNNPFTSLPNWNINNVTLAISNEIKYLGTDIGSLTGTTHCDNWVSASNK